MTLQNAWRRLALAMVGSAIAATLMVGVGSPIASAQPGDAGTTDTDAPAAPPMTGDQALAIIKSEYDLGSGDGQLSNLIHEVLVMRNLGFKPSKANQDAIVAALDKRPNQAPLIAALKETVAYQHKIQAQAAAQQQQGGGQNGFSIGGPPNPFDSGGIILGGPVG